MKKLFIIMAFLSLCSCGAKQPIAPEPQNTKYVTEQITDNSSEDNYKAECKYVPFDEVSKDLEALKGSKLTFTGPIINIIDNVYYMTVTKSESGHYVNIVAFKGSLINDISKGDIVTIYGESKGFYEHTTSLGKECKDPMIEVAYIEKGEQ
jgi:hypothetical protein